MLILRKSTDRGTNNSDWLTTYHSFSFAEYHDPEWMGFGHLRVINEDIIQPNKGFGMHAHHDMEIVTYIIQGTLAHKDNMGNGSIIKPGEIQRMSAGRGVKHSEFNASHTEPLHLLQIWVKPKILGIEPSYEQKPIKRVDNQLVLIASPEAGDNHVMIHQTVQIFVGYFMPGNDLVAPLEHRRCWIQVISGQILVNEQVLKSGDGLGIEAEQEIIMHCIEPSEFLLFKEP